MDKSQELLNQSPRLKDGDAAKKVIKKISRRRRKRTNIKQETEKKAVQDQRKENKDNPKEEDEKGSGPVPNMLLAVQGKV